MRKHHQTFLKAILVENIHDFDSFWALFLYGRFNGNMRFPSYRPILKREYLELGIEFLHSVKSGDLILKNTFI